MKSDPRGFVPHFVRLSLPGLVGVALALSLVACQRSLVDPDFERVKTEAIEGFRLPDLRRATKQTLLSMGMQPLNTQETATGTRYIVASQTFEEYEVLITGEARSLSHNVVIFATNPNRAAVVERIMAGIRERLGQPQIPPGAAPPGAAGGRSRL